MVTHPLNSLNISLDNRHPWIERPSAQVQVRRLRFVPHLLQILSQSSLHRTFIGKLSSSSLQTNWSYIRDCTPFIKGSSSKPSSLDRPAPQTPSKIQFAVERYWLQTTRTVTSHRQRRMTTHRILMPCLSRQFQFKRLSLLNLKRLSVKINRVQRSL